MKIRETYVVRPRIEAEASGYGDVKSLVSLVVTVDKD
jgi:hypothetical protein